MQHGEFESSDTPYFSQKQRRARIFFLYEIEESQPEILKSLYDEVFIPFSSRLPYNDDTFDKIEMHLRRKIYKECSRKTNDPKEIKRLSLPFISKIHNAFFWTVFEAAHENYHPELIPLREAVMQWCKKQNLDADWCRSVALDSMRFWDVRNVDKWQRAKKLRWQITTSGSSGLNPQVEKSFLPCPNFPEWRPFWQRKSVYLESLKEKITESIGGFFSTHPLFAGLPEKIKQRTVNDIYKEGEIYCKKLVDYYQAKGRSHIKLSREEERKIKWTALAQVGTKPLMLSQIARNYGIAVNHVSNDVRDFLQEVDLPPRVDLFGSGRRTGIPEKKPRNIARRSPSAASSETL